MAKTRPRLVVFIPGLNTFEDDRIHIGALAFGRMSAAWEREARVRALDFASIRSPGRGDLETESARALLEFDGLAKRVTDKKEILLLGHSTGGLVARALASQRPECLAATITVGSPHGGAPAARFAMQFETRHPMLNRLFRLTGYDVREKLKAFASLTPEATADFASKHPLPTDVPIYYARCRVSPEETSLPLRALDVAFPQLNLAADSDGFIPCTSQRWGHELGEYRLDHYAELGAILHSLPSRRAVARSEFARLATDVFEILSPPTDQPSQTGSNQDEENPCENTAADR